MNYRCVILVSSFDGFADLWQPFFTLFFRYWPDCPYPIYVISNTKQCEDARVSTLAIGPDGKWANNLFAALSRISATHIMYMQDDYFLTKKVDSAKMQALVDHAIKNNIACIRLFPEPGPDMPYHESGIGVISQNADYRVSLQAALWDVQALKALMRRNESGWDMEIKGTERAHNVRNIFLSVTEAAINYTEGVTKGKWNIKALQHCRKEKVALQRNVRDTNYGIYYRSQRDRLRKFIKKL